MKKKNLRKYRDRMRILKVAIFLAFTVFIFGVAPNYKINYVPNKTNLIINNRNVTMVSQKRDVHITYVGEVEIVYVSFDDIKNYFDKYLTYDDNNARLITTFETKEASMKLGEKQIQINGIMNQILAPLIMKEDMLYLPLSEMAEVYNVDVTYLAKSDTVIIESRDRKITKGHVSKNVNIKTVSETFSKTVEEVKMGEMLTVISTDKGWSRVRTEAGRLGYIKNKYVENKIDVRDDLEIASENKLDRVTMYWDNYAVYSRAPNRTEELNGVNVVSPSFFEIENAEGDIRANIGDAEKSYIEWAGNNNYQVWPMLSNSIAGINKDIMTKILNDYTLRQKLITNIVDTVVKNKLDGITICFDNINKEDRDVFSRCIIELDPRMNEYGKKICVDVTSVNDVESYDRNIIADVSDYIIFMEQEQSVKEFMENEKVAAEKIILGVHKYQMNAAEEQVLREKMLLKDEYNLAGITLWSRGKETGTFLNELQENNNI